MLGAAVGTLGKRQTDREPGTQTGRQTDRHTGRQTDILEIWKHLGTHDYWQYIRKDGIGRGC